MRTETRTEIPKPRVRPRVFRWRAFLVGADVVAIAAGLVGAVLVSGSLAPPWWVCALYGTCVLVFMAALWLYNSRLAAFRTEEFARIGKSCIRAALVPALLGLVFDVSIDLRAGLALLAFTFAAVATEREILRWWFARRRRSGQGLWTSILVASEDDGRELGDAIEADKASPHTIVGKLDPAECTTSEALLTKAVALARSSDAGGAVVVESSLDGGATNGLVRGLLEAGLYVDLASTLSDISTDRLATRNLGPSIATWIAPRRRGGWRGRAKRVFDLGLSLTALSVLSPVFIVIAIVIRVTSPGPVFFRQERVGRDGEPFDVLKFRSMVVDAEERLKQLAAENEGDGPLFKMKSDPRVTKIGGFLRKTSLDELPQLVNVFRNEMSLVGPRPALRSEMADWDPALYARLQVKPGITGMWQVSGRSGTTFAEYTRLDLYYVHNWSLLVDLSILAKTIPAVLKSDGAF